MYPSSHHQTVMEAAVHHSPVILLLGDRSGGTDEFDQWLNTCSYRTCEAEDVFELLDQVSDFTVRERPDVVFLHIGSNAEEQAFARNLVAAGAGDAGVPVIDLAATPSAITHKDFDETIAGLVCQLDQFLPECEAAKARG